MPNKLRENQHATRKIPTMGYQGIGTGEGATEGFSQETTKKTSRSTVLQAGVGISAPGASAATRHTTITDTKDIAHRTQSGINDKAVKIEDKKT